MSTGTVICDRCALLAILGATFGTGAIVTARQSFASVDFYLEEVRAKVDAPLTDAPAIQLGNVACGALRAGVAKGLTFGKARHEADQAVGRTSYQLGVELTMADGMFLVEAAENQLC